MRWMTRCAWDGHELEDDDNTDVASHERVCSKHLTLFKSAIAHMSIAA